MQLRVQLDSERLKRRRLAQRWSQEDFAAAADVGVRTIQRAEAGGVVSLATARALASALKETIDMLEEKPHTSPTHQTAPIGAIAGVSLAVTGSLIAVASSFEGASPVMRETVGWALLLDGPAGGALGATLGLTAAAAGYLTHRRGQRSEEI